jgi:hypothetical protein
MVGDSEANMVEVGEWDFQRVPIFRRDELGVGGAPTSLLVIPDDLDKRKVISILSHE